VSLLIGVLAATGASALYSLGIGVQAIDARDAGRQHALRISLLTHLLRRGRWLAGTAMTAFGWPLQILALLFAPLEVVQPALAIGLLILLALGERLLGERPGPRELVAVCAIVAGVAGIAALAPERTTNHVHGIALVLVLALLAAAALAPFVAQAIGRDIANLAMVGAGLAFAWGALATKLVADAASGGHWLSAAVWAAAAIAASLFGLTAEMSALQRRPAILVAPVVFVAQTFVPVMLAPLILHESFLDTPLSGVPLLACMLVLLTGATTLARSPALLALSARRRGSEAQSRGGDAQRGNDGSGRPDSRAARRAETSVPTARKSPVDPWSRITMTSPAPSGREKRSPPN
jgi:drug/metabolite transporter (DMT)-like permease